MKKTIVSLALLVSHFLTAEDIIGIIGGENINTNTAYAAFISADGTATELTGTGFPQSIGTITAVAGASAGKAIIAGENNSLHNYAAFVSSNGTLTQISGSALPSTVTLAAVAINAGGEALIAGSNNTGAVPAYAALVSSNGTITSLSGGAGFPSTTGTIESVAINASGYGIMGGNGAATAGYASLISPNGTLQQLLGGGFPSTSGTIFSVAINSSGKGLIGGNDNTGAQPAYAAVVDPDGTLHPLSGGGFPTSGGAAILTVALNDSGVGLIGGQGTGGGSYAARVHSDNTLTQLTGAGLSGVGDVTAIAINASGAGILGANFGYAAFISPNDTLTQISVPVGLATNSVAITDAGVGLIGGQVMAFTAYAAVVAPNGSVTLISGGNFPPFEGVINSVSTILMSAAATTPTSIGPYSAASNTQLAASYALTAHLRMKNTGVANPTPEVALLADATDSKRQLPTSLPSQQKPYTVWMEPFGDYVHQSASGSIPATANTIGGGLIGFDCRIRSAILGAAAGYAFNYLHYGQSLGHGNLQEEMACLYTAYQRPYFYMNAVVWGGIYQMHNVRHSLFGLATSKAHLWGWLLSPHLEIGSPISPTRHPWCTFEPFAQADWVNNWQKAFTEKGASGLNVKMDGQYNSLLRSEAGLRVYQSLNYAWGKVLLEEKASYVNLAPFHVHTATTAFVGSASTFPVAIASTKVQNLGGTEFRLAFLPANCKMPYGVLSFQGDFGSSYQSYFGSVELGKNF
ncbi:MAG: autotransporter domain-containing protein [Chlamydiia bacterium]|nr:autotransporter domain-containing protein [Chlamydiia bacterium]